MDWYAPIVVMPKSSCSVQTWMNPIKLNEIVRLENVPLPKTVQLYAQLSWATTFSKLDCNSRFYTAERALTGTLSICYSVQALLLQTTPFQDQLRTWSLPQEMNEILMGIPSDFDDVLLSGTSPPPPPHPLPIPPNNTITDSSKPNEKFVFATDSMQFNFTQRITTGPDNVEQPPVSSDQKTSPSCGDCLGWSCRHAGKSVPNPAELTKFVRNLLKKETAQSW